MSRLWGLPAALAGVALARLSGCQISGGDGRALLARAPARSFVSRFLTERGFNAITIGNVVILCASPTPTLLQHELEHVRQWEQWGLLFVAAYPLASLWSRLRGAGWHRGNCFERAARAAAGER